MSVPEVYEQGMADVAMVRAPTVELLRRYSRVPEAGDPEEAERLVTSLILMSERNFYDLARRDSPRGARRPSLLGWRASAAGFRAHG